MGNVGDVVRHLEYIRVSRLMAEATSPCNMSSAPEKRSVTDSEKSLSDQDVLARLGYKQEFKRDFSRLELFGLSFSIVGVVQSIA